MSNSSESSNNKCEICGRQATAGIVDEKSEKGIIRYTCADHYMNIYEKIIKDDGSQK